MHPLANSEIPDEMPQNVAFHLGLHSFKNKNDLQIRKQYYWEIITCHLSVYTIDHPKFLV